jgi:phage repressor protein C with HTH and peptisase S24 domain
MINIRKVTGKSMEPTLKEGDYVIVGKPSTISKGDMVVVSHAGKEKIKRVKKIRGEKYWLEGDNQTFSSDFWASREQIIKKVLKKFG